MPIYEYRCQACGIELEKLQKLNDPLLVECPECGRETLVKLVSASSFRLKGGGWYETDFKTGKKKNGAGEADGSGDIAGKSGDIAGKSGDSVGKTTAGESAAGNAGKEGGDSKKGSGDSKKEGGDNSKSGKAAVKETAATAAKTTTSSTTGGGAA